MPAHKNSDELLQVIAHFNAAVTNQRLYAVQHPQMARYLNNAFEALIQAVRAQGELTFIVVDGELVINNHTLSSRTPHLRQFVQILTRCAIERVSFAPGMTLAELTALTQDLAATDRAVVRGSAGIKLGKLKMASTSSRMGVLSPEARQKMKELGLLDDKPIDEMKEVFQSIQAARQVPMGALNQVVHGFISGMLYNIQPLGLLTSLKSSDEYTFTHAINVCVLTMAQAEMLGIKSGRLHDIGVAAALHDVGKMFVPDEILNKPGKLNDDEWTLMRHHTIRGARYILKMDGLPRLAFLAALEHHIRYDGGGYPELEKGWKPNIVSQMIAVADLFDAMRSRRPYQAPKPDDLVVKILAEERGTTFNPLLVDNFLHILQRHGTDQSAPAASDANGP